MAGLFDFVGSTVKSAESLVLQQWSQRISFKYLYTQV